MNKVVCYGQLSHHITWHYFSSSASLAFKHIVNRTSQTMHPVRGLRVLCRDHEVFPAEGHHVHRPAPERGGIRLHRGDRGVPLGNQKRERSLRKEILPFRDLSHALF